MTIIKSILLSLFVLVWNIIITCYIDIYIPFFHAMQLKTESVRHLETIQDICEIAAKYQHDELKFLERMDYMKPRFDTSLLAYLTFAIAEEEATLKKKASPKSAFQIFDY